MTQAWGPILFLRAKVRGLAGNFPDSLRRSFLPDFFHLCIFLWRLKRPVPTGALPVVLSSYRRVLWELAVLPCSDGLMWVANQTFWSGILSVLSPYPFPRTLFLFTLSAEETEWRFFSFYLMIKSSSGWVPPGSSSVLTSPLHLKSGSVPLESLTALRDLERIKVPLPFWSTLISVVYSLHSSFIYRIPHGASLNMLSRT